MKRNKFEKLKKKLVGKMLHLNDLYGNTTKVLVLKVLEYKRPYLQWYEGRSNYDPGYYYELYPHVVCELMIIETGEVKTPGYGRYYCDFLNKLLGFATTIG